VGDDDIFMGVERIACEGLQQRYHHNHGRLFGPSALQIWRSAHARNIKPVRLGPAVGGFPAMQRAVRTRNLRLHNGTEQLIVLIFI
jgi:hypothetical protein